MTTMSRVYHFVFKILDFLNMVLKVIRDKDVSQRKLVDRFIVLKPATTTLDTA